MNIQQSVALVTGASRGLGLSLAKALVDRGARKVYAATRTPTPSSIDGVVPVALDVTKPETIAAAARELGDVTLIVNNAGILRPRRLLAGDIVANAREEFETNYFGLLAVSEAFAPVLAKNGGGAILNVLSVLSWVAPPGSTTYCASKAAAWALTNGLRAELGPQGTQVTAVHVGYIDTDMVRGLDVPKVRPEEVARLALDGVEAGSDEVLVDELTRKVKDGLSQGLYLRPPSGPTG
ncbi:SDR family oxidoreductase [Stigmatella sp. ncwal1]|uniref:SDR family oxidoreductase n=1 Tax=Stigmatella ashevillensis TaxID=2995309 RepID=A0ABT5D750_9BACT|nr:SDR family oxidoreductase [Stigmatella ashevillena]MDC0709481.1 SDR family oxidoreductase [Stigmatella ashevillena]